MSAGTGGTTATLGRYIRYRRLATRLCVADPEDSAFFEAFDTGNMAATRDRGSRIEGIGRPRVEPSFIPKVIDHMLRVPDEECWRPCARCRAGSAVALAGRPAPTSSACARWPRAWGPRARRSCW